MPSPERTPRRYRLRLIGRSGGTRMATEVHTRAEALEWVRRGLSSGRRIQIQEVRA